MRAEAEPRPDYRPAEKRTTRADREATADLLAEHYAAGSLDDEEYQERLDTAMSAKFPSALRGVAADLPDLPKPPPPPPEPVPEPRVWDRERASYRVWAPGQWALQNAAAIALAIGAVAMSGATGGRLAGVSLLLCCLLNGALGLRKNRALGAVGFVSGLLLILGTALMIVLTRRRSPSRAGGLGAD